MRRLVLTSVLAGALLLVPVAIAATPGTYEGWLHKPNGERYKGSLSLLTVRDTAQGQRFRLSVYNMRLGCPYLDKNGRKAKARFRFVYRDGDVDGSFINSVGEFPDDGSPTHRVRVVGRFIGRRFDGRVTVRSAPGITGACTGSSRIVVRR